MLRVMSKRAVASVLWFVSIAFAYEVVWSLTGVPRAVGPVLAAVVAAFVAVDPIRLFWPSTSSATRETPEMAPAALPSVGRSLPTA